MTLRNLFNIILKVLGVICIKDIFTTIPELISLILNLTKDRGSLDEIIWYFASTILVLICYVLFPYFLIFKTDSVIDSLKLDKGSSTDENISINIHRSTVLSISIIVIGGFLAINEVPVLCKQVFYYFKEKQLPYNMARVSPANIWVSVIKIIIGLFLMSGQKQLVALIEKQRKK